MKFIYVTDLHGDESKYIYILEFAGKNNIPLVINGGDLYPKDDHEGQSAFITDFLDTHFDAYNKAGIHFLILPGNDDFKILDPLFEKTINKYPQYCHNIANKKMELFGFSFIGFNLVQDAPFLLKDRFRKDLIVGSFGPATNDGIYSVESGFRKINWVEEYYSLPSLEEEMELLPVPQNYQQTIYIIHQPPKECTLAIIYGGKDVGSIAVQNYLLKNQPLLSLHGHIHESFKMSGLWLTRLGETIAIQPGQEYNLIFIEGDLRSMQFTRKEITA